MSEKIGELYSKFQSKEFRDDLAQCIKSKGSKGMDYIPWSNVMDRFFRACPTAEYKFHEYQVDLTEGGVTVKRVLPYTGDSKRGYFVTTSVTCYGVTRSMTSPVYGKTFATVALTPQANQIHNAQMRCLCKNVAMFGCGIELWTREEATQLEAEDATPVETGIPEDEVINVAKQVFGGKEVKTESCPKCDSKLTQKSSKFGTFLACTGYPTCKFTKPIS
jgi:hypothetical protein